jgi:hypothetical protein
MEWLVGGAEALSGAVCIAVGSLVTWAFRGGPSDLKHVMLVPVVALFLIVVGASVLARGAGLW